MDPNFTKTLCELTGSEKATEVLSLRLTPSDYDEIKLKAKSAGLSCSEYLRRLSRGCEIRARLTPEQLEMAEKVKELTLNVKRFNSVLREFTKDMNEQQRYSFLINGKTIGKWSEIIEECMKFEQEFMKLIKF